MAQLFTMDGSNRYAFAPSPELVEGLPPGFTSSSHHAYQALDRLHGAQLHRAILQSAVFWTPSPPGPFRFITYHAPGNKLRDVGYGIGMTNSITL